MIILLLKVFFISYLQSISFSMVSRARNRDNHFYHVTCAVAANGIWFVTMRELVLMDMDYILALPYIIGTVLGSLSGAKVSMIIERRINARSDSHLKE